MITSGYVVFGDVSRETFWHVFCSAQTQTTFKQRLNIHHKAFKQYLNTIQTFLCSSLLLFDSYPLHLSIHIKRSFLSTLSYLFYLISLSFILLGFLLSLWFLFFGLFGFFGFFVFGFFGVWFWCWLFMWFGARMMLVQLMVIGLNLDAWRRLWEARSEAFERIWWDDIGEDKRACREP